MRAQTLIKWIVAFAALSVVGVVFLHVQPTAAASGGFCQSNDTAKKAVNACEYGFDNAARITTETCEDYSKSEEQDACKEGYGHALSIDTNKRTANAERCNVSGLGWIVCWVSKFIAKLADGLFIVLEQLMKVSPLNQTQAGGRELFAVWSLFRNIANVVFVIVLLFIIISHVTSIGLKNYAIKQAMPRIIVGIFLINCSFIVCGLVVDITNILGDSLKGLLTSVAIPVKPQFSAWDSIVAVGLIGTGGLIVYLNIFAIMPIIFSGIIALLMTVVILVIRHTLIIALVIIAPLAFALNILPSTQQWFNKWWSAFILLAMVYPTISFIFGATQVASGVISASAPDGMVGTIIFGTFALGVQSIPFFITPLLLKVGGGLLNRFTGIINNPSKGLIDRSKRGVEQWSKNKTNIREANALVGNSKGVHAAFTRKRSRTEQVAKYHESQLSDFSSGAYGRYVSSPGRRDELARSAAKNAAKGEEDNTFDRIKGGLANTSIQIDITDIDAAEATWEDSNTSFADMKKALETGVHNDGTTVSSDERAAAYKRIAAASGDNVDQIHKLLDEVSQLNDGGKAALALADGIDASGVASSAAHLDARTTNEIRSQVREGNHTAIANSTQTVANAANRGAFNSAATLSNQSAGTNAKLVEASKSGLINQNAHQNIVSSRNAVNSNEKLRVNQSAKARQNLSAL